MDIIQLEFTTKELVTGCTWATIDLLPKGEGKYSGIVLVEVFWKVISFIIDRLLADYIKFHNILHGFRAQGGTGTATFESKIF